MYPYANTPHRPNGQRGNGPAFSQNAEFLRNYLKNGSGPKNNKNGNQKGQHQNHGRNNNHNNQGHKNNKGGANKNGFKAHYSGNRNGNQNGNRNNHNPQGNRHWPQGPRQQNSQSQSRPPHHQSSYNKPQRNPYQGGGQNMNNHNNRNMGNPGPYNGRENAPPRNQNHWQQPQINHPHAHPSPSICSDDLEANSIMSDFAMSSPHIPQGAFMCFVPDEDIEMPDAPPINHGAFDYYSVLERIINQAMEAHQIDVDSLVCQVTSEIKALKRQNKDLSDAVMAMFMRTWGIPPMD